MSTSPVNGRKRIGQSTIVAVIAIAISIILSTVTMWQTSKRETAQVAHDERKQVTEKLDVLSNKINDLSLTVGKIGQRLEDHLEHPR